MYLNYRGIVRVIAIFSAVMGIAMLPSALVSLVYREFDTVLSFTGVTIPLCILAILILKLVKPSPVPFNPFLHKPISLCIDNGWMRLLGIIFRQLTSVYHTFLF